MKTLVLSTAMTVTLALPAVGQDPTAALDIGFGGEADLFLDRKVFGLDMTGDEHAGELIVPEGYEEAESSAFLGQTVHFGDGVTELGTVDTVYVDETGTRRLVITLAEEVDMAMVDAIYVTVPPQSAAAGSVTLNMTEEQLAGIAANWAD
jgi:hypothetical protein